MSETYKKSIISGFTQIGNYKSEIWLAILAKIFQIFLLILFWRIISKTSSSVALDLPSLISYFIVANIVQALVDGENMRFARTLTQEIKMGTVSSYLLRPVNPVLFLYSRFIGNQGLVIIISSFLTLTMFLLYFQGNLLKIILFLVVIILAMICSFAINLIFGSITFWTIESQSLRHVIAHIIRVFSGSLLPLTFFPLAIKNILLFTPFPSFAYIPSILVRGNINSDIILGIASTLVWTILLLMLGFWVWKKGVKQYESVGI